MLYMLLRFITVKITANIVFTVILSCLLSFYFTNPLPALAYSLYPSENFVALKIENF